MLSAPNRVTFEITRRCNLDCEHCIRAAGDPLPNELSTEAVRDALTTFDEMGVFEVSITGGEPLLRPDIFEILAHLARLDLDFRLLTTGYYIDEPMAERLATAGVERVQISLDGLPETHNEFRRDTEAFQRSAAAIEHLEQEGVDVQVSSVVTQKTFRDIPDLVDRCAELGADAFKILALQPFGRAVETGLEDLTEEQYSWLLDKLDEKQQYHDEMSISRGARFKPERLERERKRISETESNIPQHERLSTCPGGISECFVESTGDVYPCELLSDDLFGADHRAGNVAETSFSDIWEHATAFHQMRELSIDDLADECRNCEFASFCLGGCHAMAKMAENDFYAQDPRCPL
jgi:radical SAM protein with 4Fe4S-binding SPASM domain